MNPPKQAPKNYADDLPNNSLTFHYTTPVSGWGIIPFLRKKAKETAGFMCPPEKGATNKIAANKDKVTYQS